MNIEGNEEVVLISPFYPGKYAPRLSCQYIINTNAPFIRIAFDVFVTEIVYDVFEVGLGPNVSVDTRVLRISGDEAPTSLTLNASTVWITFKSDSVFEKDGYMLRIWSSAVYGKGRENMILKCTCWAYQWMNTIWQCFQPGKSIVRFR